MNNSFPRLVDGMCATLRTEVLPRLDDAFARGQVYGVINLLNTFKARADWAPAFLLLQLDAQRQALATVAAVLAAVPGAPAVAVPRAWSAPAAAELLAARDDGNRAIGEVLAWLDGPGREALPADTAARAEQALRDAMRAEVDIELKHSPRPLFAEMSGGG
jgi:hypothetical protein